MLFYNDKYDVGVVNFVEHEPPSSMIVRLKSSTLQRIPDHARILEGVAKRQSLLKSYAPPQALRKSMTTFNALAWEVQSFPESEVEPFLQ